MNNFQNQPTQQQVRLRRVLANFGKGCEGKRGESEKEKEETGKEAEYELSPRTDLYKRHAIHKIIKRGDNGCDHNLLEAAKRIIEKEPSCVTLKDEEGETPLHYAAYYGEDIL